MAPSPAPTTRQIDPLYKASLDEWQALKHTHLFVAEDNAAVLVKGRLEGEAALVLTALEVNVVPLNHKHGP